MKSKIIIASALMAMLAAPVMAQTYGTTTKPATPAAGTTTGTAPPPGPKDTRDAMGKNTQCSAKDKLSDGTCKPGAKRVTDGTSGTETPSGASGPSNASGGN